MLSSLRTCSTDSLSSLAMSLSDAKTRVGGSMGLGPKRRRCTYATKSYLEALAWDMVFVEDWLLVEKIIYIQVFLHALNIEISCYA